MIKHSPEEIALINHNLAHYQEIYDRIYGMNKPVNIPSSDEVPEVTEE